MVSWWNICWDWLKFIYNENKAVSLDKDGDLLPKEYKQQRDKKWGGRYLWLMGLLIFLCKGIIRFNRTYEFTNVSGEWIELLNVIILTFAFIVMFRVMYITFKETKWMMGNYKKKVMNSGSTWKERRRYMGTGGGGGGLRDLWRMARKVGASLGVGVSGTAGSVIAADDIVNWHTGKDYAVSSKIQVGVRYIFGLDFETRAEKQAKLLNWQKEQEELQREQVQLQKEIRAIVDKEFKNKK